MFLNFERWQFYFAGFYFEMYKFMPPYPLENSDISELCPQVEPLYDGVRALLLALTLDEVCNIFEILSTNTMIFFYNIVSIYAPAQGAARNFCCAIAAHLYGKS